MLLVDYYFYFNNLEQCKRNEELQIFLVILAILIIISVIIEFLKHKYMYKAKNEKVRKLLRKL